MTGVIAAISTPPGKGGVAVIRISGEGAFDIAEKLFFPKSKRSISDYPDRVQIYGEIIEDGEVIDDVLLTRFRAPASYTGEDVVEISCHGGVLVTRTILEALFRVGAVPAEAGEFTKRAFINGRLSLTDAESIGNLLEAVSKSEIKLHSSTARERLAEKISEIRGKITNLLSSMYARIDYPDEDLGDFTKEEIRDRLYIIKESIEILLSTYRTGRAVTEGIKTVICGKPNVGKSSLYNLLLGEDAAIVTEIEGTTRDVLEQTASLGKVRLRLADTAGIRSSDNLDAVEKIGIEKSRKMMESCELLFAIFDLSRPANAEDEDIIKAIKESKAAKIAIFNKKEEAHLFDNSVTDGIFDEELYVSVKCNEEETVTAVTKAVDRLFTDERISIGSDAVLSSARQHSVMTGALDFIVTAIAALEAGFSEDAISGDVERALGAIAQMDGKSVSEEVTNDIFSKFCVGK